MLGRLVRIVCFAICIGVMVYVGCTIWPLGMDETTGLIAAMGCGLGSGLVAAVYLDSKGDQAGG